MPLAELSPAYYEKMIEIHDGDDEKVEGPDKLMPAWERSFNAASKRARGDACAAQYHSSCPRGGGELILL